MDNFGNREYNRVLSVGNLLIMCWLLKNRVNLRCKCNELFEIVRKFKAFETLWLYRYYVIYILYFYWYHIVYIILSWQLHFWTMCNYPINRGYFTLKQCVAFLKCCGCVPLTHHQFFSNLPSHFHPFPHSFIIIF